MHSAKVKCQNNMNQEKMVNWSLMNLLLTLQYLDKIRTREKTQVKRLSINNSQ